jgi:3D (Asp-Asp-Asp) domain-containing protein
VRSSRSLFRRDLLLLVLSASVLALSGCTAPVASGVTKRQTAAPAVKQGKRMKVRTTAYTHTEPGGSKNAIGGRLRFGGPTYSAAADWSWMPLGTRFRMLENGRTYVIEDYGSALVGRQTVDLYKPTRRAMNQWGVRHVDIEILEWGSRAMSLKVLEPRQRNRHVRAMCVALRKTLAAR